MKRPSVLITGGAGFVGRWFSSYLLSNGASVTVVDSLLEGGGGLSPEDWGPSHQVQATGDLTFVHDDCRVFMDSSSASANWDLVIHLAAVVGGRSTIENQPLAVAEDLEIDARFWRWVEKEKPAEVMHFSSSAAYPVKYQSDAGGSELLVEEMIEFGSDIGQPDLTYGWAKLTSEYLAFILHSRIPSKIVTFRPFSGYGEDQNLAYPFPSIMKRAVDYSRGLEKSMYVWGSGNQARDFIHISDVVRASMLAISKLPSGATVNLGTGRRTSFKSLATMALAELGLDSEVATQSERPQGVADRVAEITKLSGLGFTPSVGLEEGVRRSIDYWISL